MSVAYKRLSDPGPLIVCYHCGQSAFIQHEHEPGQPAILECSICRRETIINLIAFIGAIREES